MGDQMSEMTSGFDLTWPLISRPEPKLVSKRKASPTHQEAHEKMTGGFDLTWPLISKPEPRSHSVHTMKEIEKMPGAEAA